MWNLSLPWWELVLRGVIVYVFLLIILRITGKRQTGQLAPFDLVGESFPRRRSLRSITPLRS